MGEFNPEIQALAFRTFLESVELAQSDHLKKEAVIWFQTFQSRLPGQSKKLFKQLATAVGVDPHRLSVLIAMSSEQDIRRGLLSRRLNPDYSAEGGIHDVGGWIGDYIQYAHANEAPIAYHFWTACSILGAAAKRNFYIDRGFPQYLYPNLAVIFISSSGSKKSTAVNLASDMMYSLNSRLDDPAINYPIDKRLVMLAEISSLAVILQSLHCNIDPIGHPIDKTEGRTARSEGWKFTHRTQSLGYVIAPELSNFIGTGSAQADQKKRFLTEGLDCRNRLDDSKIMTGDKSLRDMALSLLGAETPKWLKSEIDESFLTGGIAGRSFWISREGGDKPYAWGSYPDPVIREGLLDYLVKLSVTNMTIELDVHPKARERFTKWYNEDLYPLRFIIEDERLKGYYTRKDDQIFKLAIILALSLGRTDISMEIYGRAQAIVDYEEERMIAMWNNVEQHEDMQIQGEVLDYIRTNTEGEGRKPLTWGDLTARFHSRLGNQYKTKLKEILDALEGLNRIRTFTAKSANNQQARYIKARRPS